MDTANPYAAPGANLSEALTSREYGGLRRAPFFGWSIGLMAVYMVGLLAVEGSPGGIFALLLGLCAASIWIHVLRFRNQGSSGLWALGVFVPIFGIYASLRALAFPEGYEDHRSLDTPAKLLIGLWLGAFLLGMLSAILIPMLVASQS